MLSLVYLLKNSGDKKACNIGTAMRFYYAIHGHPQWKNTTSKCSCIRDHFVIWSHFFIPHALTFPIQLEIFLFSQYLIFFLSNFPKHRDFFLHPSSRIEVLVCFFQLNKQNV